MQRLASILFTGTGCNRSRSDLRRTGASGHSRLRGAWSTGQPPDKTGGVRPYPPIAKNAITGSP
jgi:hypothetical protein